VTETEELNSVTLYYGSDVVTTTWYDTMLDISSVWNEAEFNVLGDAGGSRAVFNIGSSITVDLAFYNGSDSTPTCLGPTNAGTTGETNNLNLGPCTASLGFCGAPPCLANPQIEFTESYFLTGLGGL
jgi:hypothetical protein